MFKVKIASELFCVLVEYVCRVVVLLAPLSHCAPVVPCNYCRYVTLREEMELSTHGERIIFGDKKETRTRWSSLTRGSTNNSKLCVYNQPFALFLSPSIASTSHKLFIAQDFSWKFSGLKENHDRPTKMCNAISVSLNLHAMNVWNFHGIPL